MLFFIIGLLGFIFLVVILKSVLGEFDLILPKSFSLINFGGLVLTISGLLYGFVLLTIYNETNIDQNTILTLTSVSVFLLILSGFSFLFYKNKN